MAGDGARRARQPCRSRSAPAAPRRVASSAPSAPALDLLPLPLDSDLYAALWAQSPQRSPFSHPDAVRAFAATFALPAHVLAVVGETGALAAAVPVFEKRRGPFVAAALPPLLPVHSPLLAATPTEADTHGRQTPLDALLEALRRYSKATLRLADTLPDVRPLRWAGWTVEPRSTYTVDLAGGAEAVTSAFSTAVRREVRKNAGVFEVVEGERHAAALARFVGEAYARSGTRLGIGPGTMEALVEALAGAGLVRLVSAVRAGRPEAVVAVATDGETAFYWIAGSVPGPAMTALLGSLLPRLASEGVDRFDFCGANTPPIAEFKRRFGAVLAPAPLASIVGSRALRLAARLRP